MRIVSTTTLILFLAGAAFAQGDRGTLTGTVTDPAQAAVPAAKLTLKNSETGAAFATITTPTGNYTVASLPIGSEAIRSATLTSLVTPPAPTRISRSTSCGNW